MRRTATILGLALFLMCGCSANGPCPDKSDYKGGKPPQGTELWCEKTMPEGDIVLHGPYSGWHTESQMQTEGQYVDGEKDGVWKYWHKNGKQKTQGTYKLSLQEGIWTNWHDNGQKQMEGNYTAGKRTGTWNGWIKSGEKKDIGDWENGLPSGKWTYFHKNGKKRHEGNRDKMGMADGLWIYFYEDGKKKEEGNYAKDNKVGIWKIWDEDGIETTVDMDAPKPEDEATPPQSLKDFSARKAKE